MAEFELNEHKDKLWDWPLQGHDGVVKVIEDEQHFEVGLDATYFEAKDISVKVINGLLQVHFEHDVRSDKFGTITRTISRCYHLPERIDPKTIKSNLSNNVLFISGQKEPSVDMAEFELNEHQDKLWDWPLQGQDGIVRVHEDATHFEVGLDATYFTAKDISVKVIGDLLQINFEHEVRNDKYGTITRRISRNYHLPAGVDPKTIKSNLSHNVLFIRGEKAQ